MSPHIKIQWLGTRKDSGRGSVWGWFTETGKAEAPPYRYSGSPAPVLHCHIFWGSIGKKLHIEQVELTGEFLDTALAKAKNFRTADTEKVISKWGKVFDEELSMYLLLLKMKG